MRRLAGITLGMAILAAPTSTAYASETFTVSNPAGYSHVNTVVATNVEEPLQNNPESDSNPFVNIHQTMSQGLITMAWTTTGIVGVTGLFFLPGVITRSKSRRRIAQDNRAKAGKIEDTFECSLSNLDASYDKLVARVQKETEKYGEESLAPASSRVESAKDAIYVAKALSQSLPVKKRSLEDSEIRLGAVEAVSSAIVHANEFLTEGNSCIDYVIASEKAYADEAIVIGARLDDMKEHHSKIEAHYSELQEDFDEDYIAGAKSEVKMMKAYIDEAETSYGNLKKWLGEHNLEKAQASSKHATRSLDNAMSACRAFRSRAMAIASFDLSRDTIVSKAIAELEINIPEHRADGMARIMGDARSALKTARKLDTKSGNPVKALEEILAPVEVYRSTVASLKRKHEVTDTMKQRVNAAMDEAVRNKEIMLAKMDQYGIVPTAEERSSLERIDAVLIHNFAKIRFEAASLSLFDVDKAAEWGGNAIKTIMRAQSNAASLNARIKDAEEAEKRKRLADEEAVRRKKKKEADRRRKRRNQSSSSSSFSGSSYSGSSYGGWE